MRDELRFSKAAGKSGPGPLIAKILAEFHPKIRTEFEIRRLVREIQGTAGGKQRNLLDALQSKAVEFDRLVRQPHPYLGKPIPLAHAPFGPPRPTPPVAHPHIDPIPLGSGFGPAGAVGPSPQRAPVGTGAAGAVRPSRWALPTVKAHPYLAGAAGAGATAAGFAGAGQLLRPSLDYTPPPTDAARADQATRTLAQARSAGGAAQRAVAGLDPDAIAHGGTPSTASSGFDWGKAAPWLAGGTALGLGGLAYMKHRRDRDRDQEDEAAMKALYKGAAQKVALFGRGKPFASTDSYVFDMPADRKDTVRHLSGRGEEDYTTSPNLLRRLYERATLPGDFRMHLSMARTLYGLDPAAFPLRNRMTHLRNPQAALVAARHDPDAQDMRLAALAQWRPEQPPPLDPDWEQDRKKERKETKEAADSTPTAPAEGPTSDAALAALVDRKSDEFWRGAGKIGLGVAGVGGLYALGRYLNRPRKRKEASVAAYREAAARFPREAALLARLADGEPEAIKAAVARDAADPARAQAWEGLLGVLAEDLEKQAEGAAPAVPASGSELPQSPINNRQQLTAMDKSIAGMRASNPNSPLLAQSIAARGRLAGQAQQAPSAAPNSTRMAPNAPKATPLSPENQAAMDQMTAGDAVARSNKSEWLDGTNSDTWWGSYKRSPTAQIASGTALAAAGLATGGAAYLPAIASTPLPAVASTALGAAKAAPGHLWSATKAAPGAIARAPGRLWSAVKANPGRALFEGGIFGIPAIESAQTMLGHVPEAVRVQSEAQKAEADAINRATQVQAPLVAAQSRSIADETQAAVAAQKAQADALKAQEKAIQNSAALDFTQAPPEAAQRLYASSRDSVIGMLSDAAQGKVDLKDPTQLQQLQKHFSDTIERHQLISGKDAGPIRSLFEKSMADGVLDPTEQAALQEAVSSSPAFAETVERVQAQGGGDQGGFLGRVQDGAASAVGIAQQQWGAMPTWAKFAAGLGLPLAAIGLMSSVFGGGGAMGLLASVLGIGGVAAGLGAFGGNPAGALAGAAPGLEGVMPWIGKQLGFAMPGPPSAPAPGQAAAPAPVPAPVTPSGPAPVPGAAPSSAPGPAGAAPQPGGMPPIQDLAAWSAMPSDAKINYVMALPTDQKIAFMQSVLGTHGVAGARQMLANVPADKKQALVSNLNSLWYANKMSGQPTDWIDQALQAVG